MIKIKKSWEINENLVTNQKYFFDRRKFLKAMGVTTSVALLPYSLLQAKENLKKLNFQQNQKYQNQEFTAEKLFTNYNNFYEFGTDKQQVKNKAKNFKNRPWSIQVGGEVSKPKTWDIEDILKTMPLEERIYNFRCVETWSAVVPWIGFELGKLIAQSEPKASAKYVELKTFFNPKIAPAQKNSFFYPWPYTEGLTLAEAKHELAFLAVGLYGKELAPQNGAPIRLVVPWKYGFKSIKSIVSINLVSTMPKTLWNQLAPNEYGFFANVNPEVSHPRWSQASNKPLGSFFSRTATEKFNGYETQVAGLYQGMDLKKFF